MDNRLDFMVLASHMYEKQVSYDLSDIYVDDRFAQIHRDLSTIDAFKDQLSKDVRNSEAKDPRRAVVGTSVTSEHLAHRDSDHRPMNETWGKDGWKGLSEVRAEERHLPTTSHSVEQRVMSRQPQQATSWDLVYEFTLIRATGLLQLTRNHLPNTYARVIFSTISGNRSHPTDKQYSSPVVTRSSNPEWNFSVSFKLDDSTEFYSRNKDQEITIELYKLESEENGLQTNTESYLGSFYCPLFGDINSSEFALVASPEGQVPEVSKTLELDYGADEEHESSVKAFARVSIRRAKPNTDLTLAYSQSVENPFKAGFMNKSDLDDFNQVDDEALLKTKQTLDEIRKMTSHMRDDDLLQEDHFVHRLKQTIQHEGWDHHQALGSSEHEGSSLQKPNLASSENEFNRGYEPAVMSRDQPYSASSPHSTLQDTQKQVERRFPDPRDGQGAPKPREQEYQMRDSEGQAVEHPRPTPSFAEGGPNLGQRMNDSVDGGTSAVDNPFKNNMLQQESRESSQEKDKPKTKDDASWQLRKDRPVDRLMKGLKEKYPEGGLRSEDLERIERIFRSRKTDNKLFDTDDSDFD